MIYIYARLFLWPSSHVTTQNRAATGLKVNENDVCPEGKPFYDSLLVFCLNPQLVMAEMLNLIVKMPPSGIFVNVNILWFLSWTTQYSFGKSPEPAFQGTSQEIKILAFRGDVHVRLNELHISPSFKVIIFENVNCQSTWRHLLWPELISLPSTSILFLNILKASWLFIYDTTMMTCSQNNSPSLPGSFLSGKK